MRRVALRVMAFPLLVLTSAAAQHQADGLNLGKLDPARNLLRLRPIGTSHLREQFIWTHGDAAALDPSTQVSVRGQNDKILPHFFHAQFRVAALPSQATLYVAGPRSATVYLNGSQVMRFQDDGKREKGFNVSTAEVAGALKQGTNAIAIEEVRGHSSLHTGCERHD